MLLLCITFKLGKSAVASMKLVLGAITKISEKHTRVFYVGDPKKWVSEQWDLRIVKYYNLISCIAICWDAWKEIKYFRCPLLSVYGKYLAVYFWPIA